MRKLYTFLALVIIINTFAQAPQGFNYQATVRNSAGTLIVNQNVYFRFNIMLNSQTSVPVFSETHYVPTDDLGQVNLVIGTGTANTSTFSSINWGNGTYYLGIELNTGNGYVAMGTTQLLSVPYALYANTAGNSQAATPNLADVLAVNNSSNNLQIKNLADPTDLQDAVTKSYVDGLNSSSLMKFNDWANYQIWTDNTTYQLEPNSFLFLNANNVTLIFPNAPLNCCFGDVIYIYVMKKEMPIVNLQANGFPIGVRDNDAPNDLYSTSTGTLVGKLESGLNTIINVGDYWMVGDFEKTGIITNVTNVTIGTQIWSSTNLDVTTYRDGTPIPQVTDPTQWANLTTGAWCYYNNDPANNATYGKLYNWYAVAGIYDTASLNDPSLRKQLAPQGWHIPSDAEWNILIGYLDPSFNPNTIGIQSTIAGGKMKSTGTIQAGTGLWESPNAAATNESGFTGLPAGFRYVDGTFNLIGTNGLWWSSLENDIASAWNRNLNSNNGLANRNNGNKEGGLSVRCLRD